MDALLNLLPLDRLVPSAPGLLLDLATRHFYAFTLVLVRMSGLMIIAPVLGTRILPANIRILLVLAMSFLITPILHDHSRVAFHRLDGNADGRLTRDEVPEHLGERFEKLLARSSNPTKSELGPDEFYFELEIPPTLINYAWIVVGEFSLGFVLGLGVTTILLGLQLAGEIIDQQAGLGLANVFNPGFETNASVTGTFLFMLGVTLFVIMEPLNGHLMIVAALVENFQTLPIGEAYVSVTAVELLRDLVHQSLVLAVQVAAPLLATMSLVALAMGFLGHTVPQINVLVIGFPIRALTNLLILSLSVSGAARSIVDVVPKVIDQLRHALT